MSDISHGLRRDEDLEEFLRGVDSMIQEMSTNPQWDSFGLSVSRNVSLGVFLELQRQLVKRGWVISTDPETHRYSWIRILGLKGSSFNALDANQTLINEPKAKILDLGSTVTTFKVSFPSSVSWSTIARTKGEMAKLGFAMEEIPSLFPKILRRKVEYLFTKL